MLLTTLRSRLVFAGLAGMILLSPDDGGGAGTDGGQSTDANGSGAGTGAASDAGTGAEGAGKGETKPVQVSMTQAELDAMFDKRIGQARKSWEKELGDAAAAANLTKEEQLAAERDAAIKAGDDKITQANQILVNAEARLAAVTAGVKPERAAALLKLADLTDVDVDNGTVDAKSLKAAIDKAIAEYPEFKAGAAPGGASGGDMNSGGQTSEPKTLEDAITAKLAS